ncbi:hypothetical protein [Klebsiella aerogenes]|uniref:hypothetical protein n=1 Tax=Klebsiella aerogenes TaxID=548 RepID=UPI00069AB245|nr:hypothetical protein [Klebsiella aerogenes]
MDILSLLSGSVITIAVVAIFLYRRKKYRKETILDQFRHTDNGSSVEKAKALLNATDYVHATENNAIAAIWRSRKCLEHADRDKNVYAIKGSWALKKKMMTVGPDGFLNDISFPRDCGCYLTYIYNLRSLPVNMMTKNAHKILNK